MSDQGFAVPPSAASLSASADSTGIPPRSNKGPRALLVLGVLLLLVGTILGLWHSIRSNTLSDAEIARSVIAYLADPEFAGEDFSQQILGKVRFEMDDQREGYLYFSLRGTDAQVEAKRAVAFFLKNVAVLEFASPKGNTLSVGQFQLPLHSGERALFFRTKADNFTVERKQQLSFPFLAGDYTPTVEDLARFIGNHTIRQGWVYFTSGPQTRSVNFGAYVAIPGEHSLSSFVNTLCQHVPAGSTKAREQRIQLLLRLVTDEIRYEDSLFAQTIEVIRRPSEVLMRRHGDCANKAVLFASLLEQLGEDYLLLYTGSHLAIAIKQGAFSTSNGLTLTYEQQPWVICETTCAGFIPGESVLTHNYLKEIRFVQQPRKSADIIDVKTGVAAEFIK